MGNLSCIYDPQNEASLQSPRFTPNRRVTKHRITPFPQQCRRYTLLEGHIIPVIIIKIIKPDLIEVEFKINSGEHDKLYHRFLSTEDVPAGTVRQDVKNLISASSRTTVSVTRDLGCMFIGSLMLTVDNITASHAVHLTRLAAISQMAKIQSTYTLNLPLSQNGPSSIFDSCELPGGSDTDRTEAKDQMVNIRDILNPSDFPVNSTQNSNNIEKQLDEQSQNVIIHTTQSSIHLPPAIAPIVECKDQPSDQQNKIENDIQVHDPVNHINSPTLNSSPHENKSFKVIRNSLDPKPVSDQLQSSNFPPDADTLKTNIESENTDPVTQEQKDEQLISKSIDRFDLIDDYPDNALQ